jgi:hypothetical protein
MQTLRWPELAANFLKPGHATVTPIDGHGSDHGHANAALRDPAPQVIR